jgi:cholesterol oxidase
VVLEGGVALGDSRIPRGLRRRLEASTFINTIGRDDAGAELELHGDGLRLRRGRVLGRAIFDDMHADLRKLGEHYDPAKTFVGARAVMTAHPMGGAAIADTPASGVVDHRGEVFGCPGLYVADGSAYPAPPGVPPSVTIAALAERQGELLASSSAD